MNDTAGRQVPSWYRHGAPQNSKVAHALAGSRKLILHCVRFAQLKQTFRFRNFRDPIEAHARVTKPDFPLGDEDERSLK